jgi:hypothetical protein
MMKIFHFHLEDGMSNKSTLICELKDGAVKYRFFTGTASSGIPLALSNLQVGYKHGTELPMDNLSSLGNKMTKQEFTDRCRYIINMDSTKRIVNEVETEVTFEA